MTESTTSGVDTIELPRVHFTSFLRRFKALNLMYALALETITLSGPNKALGKIEAEFA